MSTSSLSSVPVAARRRAGRLTAGVAVVLLVVGVLPLVRPVPGVLRLLAVVVLLGAALLALISWGTLRSIRLESAESRLDAAVVEAAGLASGPCDCGQDHDPDEMHITDAPGCATPNSSTCEHDCAHCLIAAHKA